jgi:hypothetical protein
MGIQASDENRTGIQVSEQQWGFSRVTDRWDSGEH